MHVSKLETEPGNSFVTPKALANFSPGLSQPWGLGAGYAAEL